MRSFLNNLFSKDVSPLENPRQVNAWCKKLELADPQAQRQKVAAVVNAFLADKIKPEPAVLQALIRIDESVQMGYERIRYQYVSNPRMPKEIEQSLWQDITGLADSMVKAYLSFAKVEADGEEKQAYDAMMPLVLARCLHYVGILAKWHYFRFDRVPAQLWSQAHSLYRLSEIDGFDCNPFPLYPHHGAEVSSCADEYIQLLMLNTVSSNNLSVRQLDWVDQWLDKWSRNVLIARRFQPDHHHYCVNLSGKQGPEKIGDDSQGDPYRYWGIYELLNEVQGLIAKLESGTSPANLGLGNDVRGPACLELLKHLDVFWGMAVRNAQFTRSDRHDVSKEADVVNGLDRLHRKVRSDNERFTRQPDEAKTGVDYDEVMDMRLYGFVSARTRSRQAQAPQIVQRTEAPDWQSWRVENESEGGYGATLEVAGAEWVRPGVMIGMRFGPDDSWKVCVVRRISRMNEFQIYAGLQLLSATPVAVSIQTTSTTPAPPRALEVTDFEAFDSAALHTMNSALYLPYEVDGVTTNTLLMHSANYDADRTYDVQARERHFTVSLGRSLDKGVDWTWVTVQVLSQKH
ncbi:hypothetical protein HNQ50_000938 [Silvimonas terrae]|uniref:PilZ domain-containing protein n=1 Tax=Silvimonas terrae TaxID=300266 RepID=A0A840RCR5_9NEIS|nr:hypothetical protein [Silvimonas terrae]MBB5190216.1 hypothetical protein [Silvimonas terrae]